MSIEMEGGEKKKPNILANRSEISHFVRNDSCFQEGDKQKKVAKPPFFYSYN